MNARSGRSGTGDALAGNVLLFGRVLRAAGLDVHHGRLRRRRSRAGMGRHPQPRGRAARRCAACSCIGTTIRPLRSRPSTCSFARTARRRPACRCSPSANARASWRGRAGDGVPVQLEEVQDRPATRRQRIARRSARGARQSVSRTKDFADFTDAELERRAALLRSLPWHLGLRARDDGSGRPAAPSTFGRCSRQQSHAWRRSARPAPPPRAASRARPLVLHRRRQRIDGAVQPRAAALRVRAGAQRRPHVETFVFATRLTRSDRGGWQARGRVADSRVSRTSRTGAAARASATRCARSTALGASRHAPRPRRPDRVGRLGPRRSRRSSPGARARPPKLPPPDLAQSAAGFARATSR